MTGSESGVAKTTKAGMLTGGDKAVQDDYAARTEEDLMDDISILGKDSKVEEGCLGWQSPKPRKMKKKLSKPVVAARTSKRLA